MSMARLVITAVTIQGRSKIEVARDYGVSRVWVQKLVRRFQSEGDVTFEPRSRRPHSSPHTVDAEVEDAIIRLRKELSKQDWTPARKRLPPIWRARSRLAVAGLWCRPCRRSGGSCPGAASSAGNRRNGRDRPGAPFCTDQPNERWQADLTHWQLADGTEIAILNILDDHARLCLASHARRSTSGGEVAASFRKAFHQWGIRPVC